MMNRVAPDAPAAIALTSVETCLLDLLIGADGKQDCEQQPLSRYLTKIARLGGYLARAKDPPPGNAVMWRGLSKTDRH